MSKPTKHLQRSLKPYMLIHEGQTYAFIIISHSIDMNKIKNETTT